MTPDATAGPHGSPTTHLPQAGRTAEPYNDASSTILGNGRIVTEDRVLDVGWIEITGDRITAVGEGAPARLDVDLEGHYALPGFVDVHTHGGGGASYTAADHGQIARAADFHLRHGTTTTLASLVSDTPDALERQVRVLAECVRDGVVAGIHLEGPWLAPGKRGAHNPSVLRPPTRHEVARLLDLADGSVRMVTIAPELPGGLEAVSQVTEAGAVAAVGHTEATYEQTRAALDAGATVATHLYNAMPGLHHREPGAIAALLEDPRVTVELIADGVHVHPAMLGLAVRAAGSGRIALVTDAVEAAGLGDGMYTLGGLPVRVRNGQVRLVVNAADAAGEQVPGAGAGPVEEGSIAGSTLTMEGAFRFVVRHVGLSLVDAAAMCSTNPARALGFTGVGALRAGLRADIVLLDEAFEVSGVMRAGRWISDREK